MEKILGYIIQRIELDEGKGIMKIFWKILENNKWSMVKNEIVLMNNIYNDICKSDKEYRKKELKNFKEQFESCKNKCNEYIVFCEEKRIESRIDKNEFDKKASQIEEVFQYEDILDYRLDKVKKEYDSIYELLGKKGEALLEVRKDALKIIDKTEKLVNSIARSPKEFEKDISEINIEKNKFKSALEFGKEETENLKKAAAGSGAGIGVGIAAANLAPTAAMWVATTFGTASTGTAISALSGAAATNAALAWLGGGALASGGAGMAAGQALLALAGPVGWTVAGTSIFVSAVLFIHNKFNADVKKKREIKTIMNSISSLKKLISEIDSLIIKTKELSVGLINFQDKADHLENGIYTEFNSDEKSLLASIVNDTKALSKLISKVVGE